MKKVTGAGRHFLFLQGPHGPFFRQLARMLRATGADCVRVGFNMGDQAFWRDRHSYVRFDAPPGTWPEFLRDLLVLHTITDVVLYADTRPVHATAIQIARAQGLRVHVFEEGYLRPYWVTYERNGANGNSPLMDMAPDIIENMADGLTRDEPEAPDHWGDMREHVFYGALYHWFVMFANRRYPHFRPHRDIPVTREFRLYFKRLMLMPLHRAERALATRRIKRGGFPYHLALLQLEHDASFRAHSPLASMSEFVARVIEGFARGAPSHHHLVFKAHPLEDGRVPLKREIARCARENGLAGRVHFLNGGKLAPLLSGARSAVTVNSTAGQQALWRGLPLLALGQAIYRKPGLASDQDIEAFFAAPRPPDLARYRAFRRYLLATSQFPGGFYAARSRRQLLRNIVDRMLDDAPVYPVCPMPAGAGAAWRQQLRVVK